MSRSNNEWHPGQKALTEVAKELQDLKERFAVQSWEHGVLEGSINKIKHLIFSSDITQTPAVEIKQEQEQVQHGANCNDVYTCCKECYDKFKEWQKNN